MCFPAVNTSRESVNHDIIDSRIYAQVLEVLTFMKHIGVIFLTTRRHQTIQYIYKLQNWGQFLPLH